MPELSALSMFFVTYLFCRHLCLHLLYSIYVKLSATPSMFTSVIVMSCLYHLWLVYIFYNLSAIGISGLFTPFIFFYLIYSVYICVCCALLMLSHLLLYLYLYMLCLCLIYIFYGLSTFCMFESSALSAFFVLCLLHLRLHLLCLYLYLHLLLIISALFSFFYFYIISLNQRYLCHLMCSSI